MPDQPSFEELMERLWVPTDGEIEALQLRTERLVRRRKWEQRRGELRSWLRRAGRGN